MIHVLIVAAGNATRMNGIDKIFVDLAGKPLIVHSLALFDSCRQIDSIVIVTQQEKVERMKEAAAPYAKVAQIVAGGEHRQDSVWNGLTALKADKDDIVLIHNGSNPLLSMEDLEHCIEKAQETGAVVAGYPLQDTIKKVKDGMVNQTVSREGVWQMQTPQAARYDLFTQGFEQVRSEGKTVTDDVSVVELLGHKVHLVQCSRKNFKVTTPEDLSFAQALMEDVHMKIGFGQDSHRFTEEEKPLVLGGYTIEGEKGFDANSDGDVILHALFNAMSSAIGDHSLGYYSDEMCEQGITDSKEYLPVIFDKVQNAGYELAQMACSIEAKVPKLEPHHKAIIDSLHTITGLSKENIGLTFTTGEQLTGMGRGEGMQCLCQIQLKSKK